MKDKDIFIYLIALFFGVLLLPLIVSTIAYGLIIGYTVFYAVKHKIKPNFDKATLAFVLLYGLMALSLLWTINRDLTITGISRKSAFLIIPLLFLFIPKFSLEDTKRVFLYFSYTMGAYAIFFIMMGFWHYIKTGSIVNLTHHELVSPLDLNRVYVSFFIVTAFFHLIFNEKKSLINKLLISLLLGFLILLSSKSIIVTTLIITLFSYFKKEKMRFGLKGIVFLGFVLSILIGIFKFNPKFFTELAPRYMEIINKQDYQKNYYFNGSELRLLYTRFLFEYEKEEPILFKGFGLNATQEKLNEKCLKYNVPPGYGTEYNFHNQYNQTLAEIGLIGLLLLLYILFIGFKFAITNRYNFAIAIFIIFSTLLFTESVFNRQRGIYFFLITYFLIVNTNFTKKVADKF